MSTLAATSQLSACGRVTVGLRSSPPADILGRCCSRASPSFAFPPCAAAASNSHSLSTSAKLRIVAQAPVLVEEPRACGRAALAACNRLADPAAYPQATTLASSVPSISSSSPGGRRHVEPSHALDAPTSLVFVYGTLKQGFSNHWLVEELLASRDLMFVGTARTSERYPLVCGPFRVPFLLHLPGSGMRVHGEVYAANARALARLDELEGTDKGHYMRSILDVEDLMPSASAAGEQLDSLLHRPARTSTSSRSSGGSSGVNGSAVSSAISRRKIRAEAYFAGIAHTPGLAQACAIECYDALAATGYVPRRGRPSGRTFLEHVEHWICEQGFRDAAHTQEGVGMWPFSRLC